MNETAFYLTRDQWQAMKENVSACAPEEGCGLLAGNGCEVKAVLPIKNEAHSPVRFKMEPVEQLKAFQLMDRSGWELLAIYHSHPNGPDRPSQTDIREHFYPGVVDIIWDGSGGQWNAAAYFIDGENVTNIALITTGAP